MTASRRDLLKGVVAGGALASAGALGACSKDGGPPGKKATAAPASRTSGVALTEKVVAEAEKVAGLNFTQAERAMMLEGLQSTLETIAKVRSVTFENSEPPALVFDPKLPRRSVKSQKNILTLAGDTSSGLPGDDASIAFASVAQ
ncbi:MAG: hypothetical protein ACKVS5_11655 [Parvularculaceae bacterium]